MNLMINETSKQTVQNASLYEFILQCTLPLIKTTQGNKAHYTFLFSKKKLTRTSFCTNPEEYLKREKEKQRARELLQERRRVPFH